MADRSDAVADELWQRVRGFAERIAAMEELEALGELDEHGQARLDALRVRCARAADRAGLADALADRLADLRGRSGRARSGGQP